jgi:putative sugar O-methyltransferase
MKVAWRHLRHPKRTVDAAKARLAARWNRASLTYRGDRRYSGDSRYRLESVTEGLAPRLDDQSSDETLLKRICAAYTKAAKQQQVASAEYRPTPWWEQQRDLNLKAVREALNANDIKSLSGMYQNFFRDPCSAGLIALQSMSKDYFGGTIKDVHRRFYLIDALYRMDYWKAQTCDCYTIRDLAGPTVGNPFGIVMEGTLIRMGAEYQHYCAHRISRLLEPGPATVAEIGGGFGGMAYYLLRDRPGTTYIDFDMPESIALTAYYLLKAFPQLNFLLYGEAELTRKTISQVDVVLMPVFELADMPEGSADLTFSSHAMSDLARESMNQYLQDIARVTRSHFLHIGNEPSAKLISELADRQHHSYKLMDTCSSGWNSHTAPGADQVECLYRLERVPGGGYQ